MRKPSQILVGSAIAGLLLVALGAVLTRFDADAPELVLQPSATDKNTAGSASLYPTPQVPSGALTVSLVGGMVTTAAMGETAQAALDPDSIFSVYTQTASLAVGINTNDLDGRYVIIHRAFAEVTLPDCVPKGSVSATLMLPTAAGWSPLAGALPAPVISIHEGTWREGDFPAAQALLWTAWHAMPLVRIETQAVYDNDPGAGLWMAVPLRLEVPETRTIRLAFRDSQDLEADQLPQGDRRGYVHPLMGEPFLVFEGAGDA